MQVISTISRCYPPFVFVLFTMSRYFPQVYLNHFHIKGAGVAGLQWAWLWYRHQAASGLSLSLFLVWSTKESDFKFSSTRFIGFRSLRWKASHIGTTRTGELILHLYHHNWLGLYLAFCFCFLEPVLLWKCFQQESWSRLSGEECWKPTKVFRKQHEGAIFSLSIQNSVIFDIM